MKVRWGLTWWHLLLAAIVAVCPPLVWLTLKYGGNLTVVFVGFVGLIVAVYVGLWHPLWFYWGLAFVLAGLPFGYVPGVHLPLYLPFAAAAILAAIIYPRPETRIHRMEVAVLVLVFVSGVSVILTSLSTLGLTEFSRWAIVSLAAIALMRLSSSDLERFGRIFVWVSTANAIWGILLVTVDKTQRSFFILKPFGYDIARVDPGVRNGLQNLVNYAYGPEGSKSIRLGGTWVAGNGASIAFLIAIALALLLFVGWRRNGMVIILSVALLLTQSRQAIFTLFAGIVLVAIFHSMRARHRWQTVGTLTLGVVVALSVPYIRGRLLNSLSSSDPGGAARRDSLRDFPGQMSGQWLLGLSWTRPELTNSAKSYELNIISNTPLLHVYRAGIIVGLAFVAVMVIGCFIAYRALRSDSLPVVVYGGVFIAFCLVALQLDHSVADVPQTTLCFSILLAFIVDIDRSLHPPPIAPVHTNQLAVASAP